MTYINLNVFLISFSIGILLVYLQSPKKQVIYVYPHLDNIDKVQYRDKSNTCFNVETHSIDCNKEQKKLFSDYNIQI